MMEQVINRRNMHLAYQRVVANKGSAGVDGMPVSELQQLIQTDREAIVLSILNGTYLPQPILGVNIPRSNGTTRLLGIPTVTDRWLQQAVVQVITPLFEYAFTAHSYGFRPHKNAQQCLQQSQQYIKNKLRLPINREKSGIRKPVQFELLGHRFVAVYEKGARGRYQLAASDKSWKKLKESLKTITRKTASMSIAERITKLKSAGRGWLNYFRMGSIAIKLKGVDSWVRNRLRYCIWHDWKKPERKRKNLLQLGVDHPHAYAWSRTRKGGWTVAQSPILGTTITLERLKKRGYEPLLDYYYKVAPQLNEPLYTRPVRTVV